MTLAMLGISIHLSWARSRPGVFADVVLVSPALWDGFPSRSLVLPALTLSAIYISYIARLPRSGMLKSCWMPSARPERKD
jgi:ABC-type dipeptide/oligopeptide/nickel transport system permease component